MSFRNVLNVLVVSFWVLAQTAMAYAHDTSNSSAHGTPKAAEIHKTANSDCLNHGQTGDDKNDHHSGSLEQCCSTACSIVGPFATYELNVVVPSRDFAIELVHAPVAVNLGLLTPPPNTTF